MSRIRRSLAVAAVCLSGTLLPRLAVAEVVNFGNMSTISGVTSLDLTGTFLYALDLGAVNLATPGGGQVFPGYNNLTFTDAKSTPGVILSPATHEFSTGTPNFGAGADNDALESVLTYGRWGTLTANAKTGSITMAVSQGSTYKLQVMHYEGGNARFQDLSINGSLAVDDLQFIDETGRVFTYQFTSPSTSLLVSFGPGTGGDDWTHIDGLTLEVVPEPSALGLISLGTLGLIRNVSRARRNSRQRPEHELPSERKAMRCGLGVVGFFGRRAEE